MGRYPFLTMAKKYLDEIGQDLNDGRNSTLPELRRKLEMLGRKFGDLKEMGLVSTTNPKKMTTEDVKAFVRSEKARGNSGAYISKQLGMLNGLLTYSGNPVIGSMLQRPGRSGLPTAPRDGPKRSYTLETVRRFLDRVLEHAEATGEWMYVAAYGLSCLYFGFGLRPKEARMAKLRDLETENWRVWVSHPKGQGKWTEGDYAVILPPFRSYLARFLEMRGPHLEAAGKDPLGPSEFLVPRLEPVTQGDPPRDHYDVRGVYSMFRKLREITGLPVSPKDGRPSYGQIAKDHGVPLESCSVLLRHTDVKTTQAYYITLRPDTAYRDLDRYFKENAECENQFAQIDFSSTDGKTV
jgi:integrase